MFFPYLNNYQEKSIVVMDAWSYGSLTMVTVRGRGNQSAFYLF